MKYITMKELINPKSNESSKRFLVIISTYFLMLLSCLLFLPYEIKPNNYELLKMIVGAFTVIITSAFIMNGIENVKRIKQDGNTNQPEQEVH